MSIRVKVDEDLPRQVAELFAACGHDAVTVVMQGWQGLADKALWPRIQQKERWLVTAIKALQICVSIRRVAMPVSSFSGWMKKVDVATWS
jgi:Domain of unknown function (DUF5615)